MNSEPYGLPDLGTSPELTLFELKDRLDVTRDELIKACKEHYIDSDKTSLRKIYLTAAENRIAFRDIIVDIITTGQETHTAKISMICSLLEEEFSSREVDLNNIIPKLRLSAPVYKSEPEIIDLIYEQILAQDYMEEPEELILDKFNDQLNQDLAAFLLAMRKEQVIPDNLRFLKEVAKVAVVAGVTAWLVSRKYRKN